MERRTLQSDKPCLVRAEGGKPTRIQGYAARYFDSSDVAGTEYVIGQYGSFSVRERLMVGCFDRTIREGDIRALFNHNPDNLLGRNKSGTLKLYTDAKGLRYEITPPDTQCARDLMACLQRNDISGSSFSFQYVTKSIVETKMADGSSVDIIEVRDVDLYDVGPVVFPAYSSTTAEARKSDPTTARGRRAAALARADQVDQELRDLDRRLARSKPLSRREQVAVRVAELDAEDPFAAMAHDLDKIARFRAAELRRDGNNRWFNSRRI